MVWNFHDSIFCKFINVPSSSKIICIINHGKCKGKYKNISIKRAIFYRATVNRAIKISTIDSRVKNPVKKNMHKPRYWGNNASEHMRKNVKTRFCNPKRYEPIYSALYIRHSAGLNASTSTTAKQRHKILNGRLAFAQAE